MVFINMFIKKYIQYISDLKRLVCILYYSSLVLFDFFCFLSIQIFIWSLIRLIDFEMISVLASKYTFGWRESMTFDLHKFLTSVCSLPKIVFVYYINNIPPLKYSSCIPPKSCFVLNATPSNVGLADVCSISSSSVSLFFSFPYLYPPSSSSNFFSNHKFHVVLKINTKPPNPHVECHSKFHNILIQSSHANRAKTLEEQQSDV